MVFQWMFCLDFVVDDFFGGTTSGAARDFDVIPRELCLVGLSVSERVVGCSPCCVVVLGKRVVNAVGGGNRGGGGNSNGERGSHGVVFLSCGRMASIFL